MTRALPAACLAAALATAPADVRLGNAPLLDARAGGDALCAAYAGAELVWERDGLYSTSGLTPASEDFDRTPPHTWIGWAATQSTFTRQPLLPSAWIQSATPGAQYSITRFQIDRDTRRTTQIQVHLYVTQQAGTPPITTYPQNRRLLSAIETGAWHLSAGGTAIALSGPGSTASNTRDVNDGLYTWAPSNAGQTALGALLTGLLDGKVADEVVLTIPHTGEPHAAVTRFGASAGSGSQAVLTLDESSLPVTPTLNATVTHTTSFDVYEQGNATPISAGQEPGPYTTITHPLPAVTATNKPGSAGRDYTLEVRNSALATCGTRHATARIRTVRAPTLTALTIGSPGVSQGPFYTQTCSSVDWTATAGDPAATWSWSQSGVHVAHLPSSRNSAPGRGPQRFCISGTPGGSTALTLTGANEAGAASRSGTIHWPGGGG